MLALFTSSKERRKIPEICRQRQRCSIKWCSVSQCQTLLLQQSKIIIKMMAPSPPLFLCQSAFVRLHLSYYSFKHISDSLIKNQLRHHDIPWHTGMDWCCYMYVRTHCLCHCVLINALIGWRLQQPRLTTALIVHRNSIPPVLLQNKSALASSYHPQKHLYFSLHWSLRFINSCGKNLHIIGLHGQNVHSSYQKHTWLHSKCLQTMYVYTSCRKILYIYTPVS